MITDNFIYKGFIIMINHVGNFYYFYYYVFYWIACAAPHSTRIFNLYAKLKTSCAICESCIPFLLNISVSHHHDSHDDGSGGGNDDDDDDDTNINALIITSIL